MCHYTTPCVILTPCVITSTPCVITLTTRILPPLANLLWGDLVLPRTHNRNKFLLGCRPSLNKGFASIVTNVSVLPKTYICNTPQAQPYQPVPYILKGMLGIKTIEPTLT